MAERNLTTEEKIQYQRLMEQKQAQERRINPSSDLDLQLLVTNPVWGRTSEITQKLKKDLKKLELRELKKGDIIYKDGEPYVVNQDATLEDERSLWEELSAIYTRDLRLGNLKSWNGEDVAVKYYIDLAGDFLQEGFKEPFFKCMKQAVTVLEISQSSGGFLRNRQATFTHENVLRDMGPPKRNLLGMAKKDNN